MKRNAVIGFERVPKQNDVIPVEMTLNVALVVKPMVFLTKIDNQVIKRKRMHRSVNVGWTKYNDAPVLTQYINIRIG